jgi:hypothetical protein
MSVLYLSRHRSLLSTFEASDQQSAQARVNLARCRSPNSTVVCVGPLSGAAVALVRVPPTHNDRPVVPSAWNVPTDQPGAGDKASGRVAPQSFALDYEAPEYSWCPMIAVGA